MVLGCICEWTPVCPFCISRSYLHKRRRYPGKYLFTNAVRGPVSRRGLQNAYKALAEYANSQVPRPHSSRVSGALEWVRLGLSLETTATIGAWSDVKTLKHYVGAAVMTMRVRKELSGARLVTAALEAKYGELLKKVTELCDKRQPHVVERKREDSQFDLLQALTLVRVDRRPWRWHHNRDCEGPAERWVTECGEVMNVATMSLLAWVSRPEVDPCCSKCAKKVAKKRAAVI